MAESVISLGRKGQVERVVTGTWREQHRKMDASSWLLVRGQSQPMVNPEEMSWKDILTSHSSLLPSPFPPSYLPNSVWNQRARVESRQIINRCVFCSSNFFYPYSLFSIQSRQWVSIASKEKWFHQKWEKKLFSFLKQKLLMYIIS